MGHGFAVLCLALLTMGVGPCQDEPAADEPGAEEPAKVDSPSAVAPVRVLHAMVDVGEVVLRVDGELMTTPATVAPLAGVAPMMTLAAGERVLEVLRAKPKDASADASAAVAAPGTEEDQAGAEAARSPSDTRGAPKGAAGEGEDEGADGEGAVEAGEVLLKATIMVRADLPQFLLLGGALAPREGEQPITARVLRDDQAAEVASGQVLARAIHASVNLPPLDMTLSAPGEPEGLSFVNVSFGRGAAYRAVKPGLWRLRIVSGLDKDASPVYDDKKAALTGKGRHTLVVTGRHGDRERPLRVWILQPELDKDGGG